MINDGDTAFVLLSAALVMVMTPGLAFFYGGLVRKKNMLSVLMQCFMLMCIITLQWVIFGYSLGKSQEILASLAGADLPVMLHPEILRLTGICESLGAVFPAHREFSAARVAGHVVLAPPQPAHSPWLARIEPRRTAMVTGWAMDRSARYRLGCDEAFALSDHADFPDLLAFVDRVQPRRVYTVHGFAAEFAQTLRARGIDALALGKENQLEFPLPPED